MKCLCAGLSTQIGGDASENESCVYVKTHKWKLYKLLSSFVS